MALNLVAFLILAVSIQGSQYPKVDRVFVATPYNGSIIFEYANTVIPEGKELTDDLVKCFVSKLRATGLFRDVRIKLRTLEDGNRANIEVLPEWDDSVETFVIRELAFDGLNDTDRETLRQHLRKRGVKPGIRLFEYHLSEIKAMIFEAVQRISERNPEREEELDALLSNLSFDLRVIAPRTVRVQAGFSKTAPCE